MVDSVRPEDRHRTIVGTNAERLAYDTKLLKPTTHWYEEDTASEFEWTGTYWQNIVLRGASNIHDADVHNVPVNDYFHRHGVSTTLSASVVAGATAISVVSSAGFNIGDLVHLGPLDESQEPIHPAITNIIVNVLVLDRPLDFAYNAGDNVSQAIADMSSAIGTLAAPISYKYRPHSGRVEHELRVILSMTHAAAADDSTFGDQAALTNGVVFRASVSGQTGTFTNWKKNSDIILDMFDVVYTDKAGPGLFGTRGRGSFAEIEVAVVLNQANGDYLEMLVQDDLTGLSDFRVKVQGHIEGA